MANSFSLEQGQVTRHSAAHPDLLVSLRTNELRTRHDGRRSANTGEKLSRNYLKCWNHDSVACTQRHKLNWLTDTMMWPSSVVMAWTFLIHIQEILSSEPLFCGAWCVTRIRKYKILRVSLLCGERMEISRTKRAALSSRFYSAAQRKSSDFEAFSQWLCSVITLAARCKPLHSARSGGQFAWQRGWCSS